MQKGSASWCGVNEDVGCGGWHGVEWVGDEAGRGVLGAEKMMEKGEKNSLKGKIQAICSRLSLSLSLSNIF